jgi:Tfp pilus assembly protein PilO
MSEEPKLEDLKRNKLIKRKINKFFNDYFNWLVAAAMAIILAAGYFVVLKPYYDQAMAVVEASNQQGALDFDSKQKELNEIKKLLSSYESIDDKYKEKIRLIAPNRENKEEIFSEINRLVSQNGLLLESISLSETEDGNDFLKIDDPDLAIVSVKISVRGTDYESFKNFISALENSLPLLDVLSLNFSPTGRTSEFVIDTYYLKE